MKSLSGAIRVGIVILIVTVAGYAMFKSVSEDVTGGEGVRHWSHFRDASGLADKSRVVIAGLTIGEIAGRSLDGRFAKVTIRVKKGTAIWSNAAIYKKSSSLLGEYYLEIDPGTPESIDEQGRIVKNRLLADGDEIANVIEATSPADLMRQASETIPKVDQLLVEVRGLAADVRSVVNGPIANMASTLDKAITEDAKLVHEILVRADRIANDISKVTSGSDQQIDRILGNIEQASKDLKVLISTTQGEVETTGDAVREKLESIDRSLASLEDTMNNTKSITDKIDDDEGTLGRLVNDPTIADNITAITNDARQFTSSLFGLQTIVGLRSEWNFVSGAARTYLSVELHTRPDRYYLVEVVADGRSYVDSELVWSDTSGSFVRTSTVDEDALRFSIMYAKKWDPFTFRMGVKESSGGVGLDVDLGPLDVKIDAFDMQFDELPRLRATVLWQVHKYFYVLAGIDDALNTSDSVDIIGGNVSGAFDDRYHFGRDVFGGAMLRFNDEDLKTLLFVAGSAIAGVSGD